jgi:hypothetical protein
MPEMDGKFTKKEKEKSRHQHSADDGLKIHSPAEPSATWLKNG